MSSYAKFKAKNTKSSMDRMIDAVNEKSKKSFSRERDARFWMPTKDDIGNAAAVIRFLPSRDPEEIPWVEYFSYGFKGPQGWYINNSLASIGQSDPMAAFNKSMWDTGDPVKQEIVRGRTRRTNYVSNILVIDDKANADNNGRVFLYRYGKKIYGMIENAIRPEFAEDEPYDPFSWFDGADFMLRVSQKSNFPNYDSSHFKPRAPLFDVNDDAGQEKLYNQLYSLKEFVDPNNRDMYKSYQELENRLREVGVLNAPPAQEIQERTINDSWDTGAVPAEPAPAAVPVNGAGQQADNAPPSDTSEEEYNRTLEQFRSIAQNIGT